MGSEVKPEDTGYIGPLQWFRVPGGRIFLCGGEKGVAMCFVPDPEPQIFEITASEHTDEGELVTVWISGRKFVRAHA